MGSLVGRVTHGRSGKWAKWQMGEAVSGQSGKWAKWKMDEVTVNPLASMHAA